MRYHGPMTKPLLVYDGDCGFCIFWLTRWRRIVGERVEYRPYHEVALHHPHLPVERFRRAVQLIEPDGRVYEGAEAAFQAMALAPGHGHWLWMYENVPGARWIFDTGYRFIAGHRPGLWKLTRWAWGKDNVKRPLEAKAPKGALTVAAAVALGLTVWLARRRR